MNKEQREELRASATAALLVPEVNEGDHDLARGDLVLLDALDEMERERDEAREQSLFNASVAKSNLNAAARYKRERDEARAEVERLRAGG